LHPPGPPSAAPRGLTSANAPVDPETALAEASISRPSPRRWFQLSVRPRNEEVKPWSFQPHARSVRPHGRFASAVLEAGPKLPSLYCCCSRVSKLVQQADHPNLRTREVAASPLRDVGLKAAVPGPARSSTPCGQRRKSARLPDGAHRQAVAVIRGRRHSSGLFRGSAARRCCFRPCTRTRATRRCLKKAPTHENDHALSTTFRPSANEPRSVSALCESCGLAPHAVCHRAPNPVIVNATPRTADVNPAAAGLDLRTGGLSARWPSAGDRIPDTLRWRSRTESRRRPGPRRERSVPCGPRRAA